MSVKVIGKVWDSDLPRDMKFIALANADHADHEGGSVYPGRDTIAKMTGYKRRSVETITRQLVDAGILVYDGVSKLKTNSYHFDFGALAAYRQTRGRKICGAQNSTAGGRKKLPEEGVKFAGKPLEEKPSVQPEELFTLNGELPPPLNTPAIAEAWQTFLDNLVQKKRKPTDLSKKLQIRKMLEMGPERALAALKHSASNNFTGLYEPGGSARPQAAPRTARITKENAL